MAIHIQENVSLRHFNTFGIDVKASWFTQVASVEELIEAIDWAQNSNVEPFFLGGGSNLLLISDLDFLVVKLQLKGISFEDAGEKVLMKVASGENWHETVLKSLEMGLGGLENLSLIPGTMGAAPIQNIGAYGVELKQVFVDLDALNLESKKIVTISADACKFGYRDSIFKKEAKGKFVITNVRLSLSKNAQVQIGYGDVSSLLHTWNIFNPTFMDVSKAVVQIRQSKLPDPKEIGNSGSFFKNPEIDLVHFQKLKEQFSGMPSFLLDNDWVKVPAAWLIEQTGWKGFREGDAGVHARQALVLVNYGKATGLELLNLSRRIQDSVHQKFAIWLQPEVNILPS